MAVTETSGDGYALYNGVKRPDGNQYWTDLDRYPYAGYYILNSVDREYFFVSSVKPTVQGYSGTAFYAGNADYILYMYNQSSGEWSVTESSENGYFSVMGVTFVWTSEVFTNVSNPNWVSPDNQYYSLDGMTVIEWDGVTDGLTEVELLSISSGCHVYEKIISADDVKGGVYCYYNSVSGEHTTILLNDTNVEAGSNYWIDDMLGTMCVYEDNAVIYGYVFPEKGVYFIKSTDESEGGYIHLFAYPTTAEPEEPEDTTNRDFWNGVACGLCGSGTPNFSDTSPFGVGYITGCKLRALREKQGGGTGGVYDDTFPIEWNILGVGGNAGFTLNGENFVKVSNLAPSSLANISVSAQYQGGTFDFVMTEAEDNDSWAGSVTWSLAYFYCEEMDITLKIHSFSAGFTLGDWVVPEVGLYVTDFSAMGVSVDVTIEETA